MVQAVVTAAQDGAVLHVVLNDLLHDAQLHIDVTCILLLLPDFLAGAMS
jgi:hypothetical protein